MNDQFDTPGAMIQNLPVRYYCRPGVLGECGRWIRTLGVRALLSGGTRARAAAEESIATSLRRQGVDWTVHSFSGDCCLENIDILVDRIRSQRAEVLIGVGGGKALDTAKAAADRAGVPVVCVPTIAATCSATTSVSVLYDASGFFVRSLSFPSPPEMVLVDPEVIAKAPSIYLAAGILDSLSKWYELKPIYDQIPDPDVPTRSAMILSRMLLERMLARATAAIQAVDRDLVSPELIEIIDLTIYLTGIVKCLGLYTLTVGLAHAFNDALTFIPATHDALHGLKVGYGMLVQLFTQGAPQGEIDELHTLSKKIGFVPRLEQLGASTEEEEFCLVAEKCLSDVGAANMPLEITGKMLLEAIRAVEVLR